MSEDCLEVGDRVRYSEAYLRRISATQFYDLIGVVIYCYDSSQTPRNSRVVSVEFGKYESPIPECHLTYVD